MIVLHNNAFNNNVFDNNAQVVGTIIENHKVRPMKDLGKLIKVRDIKLGIVAVPGESAQQVADLLIDAGVSGILNFAPVRLEVRDAVSIASVDFSVSLEQLAFQVSLGLTGSHDEDVTASG